MNNKKVKDIVIIGSGGIGREVAYIIEEINEAQETWNILGFIDDNNDMWEKELNGHRVLGGIEYLNNMKNKPHIIVAISNCEIKRKIVERLNNKFELATIIHPSIKINTYSKIGKGTLIYPGVILTVNTEIGNNVIVSGNCGIGHDSIIGDYSTLLWGVNLSGYDNIGEEVFLGVGVNVIQKISIENKTRIKAGVIIEESI